MFRGMSTHFELSDREYAGEPIRASLFSRRWLIQLLLFACLVLSVSGNAAAWEVEAVVGEPFGVARVTLPLPHQDAGLPLARGCVRLEGSGGRAYYPAVTEGIFKRLLGEGSRRGNRLTILFLFRGSEPFEVTVASPTRQRFTVTPRRRPGRIHRRFLRRWWRGYSDVFRDLDREGGRSHVLGDYLTSMLARRLGLDRSDIGESPSEEESNEGWQALKILAGASELRARIATRANRGFVSSNGLADQQIPAKPEWQSSEARELDKEIEIERLATRIPEECFYVRFGRYENFLWLTALLNQYGGELGTMVTSRGFRTGVKQRFERQLSVRQGVLAELLGPQAIADVAAIGFDTFTREGGGSGNRIPGTQRLARH